MPHRAASPSARDAAEGRPARLATLIVSLALSACQSPSSPADAPGEPEGAEARPGAPAEAATPSTTGDEATREASADRTLGAPPTEDEAAGVPVGNAGADAPTGADAANAPGPGGEAGTRGSQASTGASGTSRDGADDAPVAGTDRPRVIVEATRPDALVDRLPSDAVWLVAVDWQALGRALASWGSAPAQALRAALARHLGGPTEPGVFSEDTLQPLAFGVWLQDDEAPVPLLAGGRSLLARAPATDDGTLPLPATGGARAVVRGEQVFVGRGRAIGAMQPEVQVPRGMRGHASWQELPADAIVTAWTRDLARLDTGGGTLVPALREAGTRGLGIALRGDGSIHVRVEADDLDAVERTLAQAQARWNAWMGVMIRQAPPEAEGLARYAGLVVDSLWSRLEVERDGDALVVRMAAPACGGPLANAGAALLLLTGVETNERLPVGALPGGADAVTRFVRFRGSVAEGCAAAATRAPRAPTSLAHLASSEVVPGAVLLFDHAALLGHALPDAAGVLPFRLEASALAQALRAGVAAVRDADDPEGSGAWVFEADTEGARQALVTPRAFGGASPEAILALEPVGMRPYGRLFATPTWPVQERVLGERLRDHAWLRVAESSPRDTWVMALVSAELIRPVLERVNAPELVAAIREAGIVSVGWSVAGPWVWFPGATLDGDALDGGMRALLAALSTGTPSAGLADALRSAEGAWQVERSAGGTLARVAPGRGGDVLVALLSALAPAVGGALPDPGLDPRAIPRPVIEVDRPLPVVPR